MQDDSSPKILPAQEGVPNDAFVLLVDDNEDATFLLERLLKKAGIQGPVESVHDGEEAVALLAAKIRLGRCLPVFVALDLKMPRCDGFEVLQWIRQQPPLEELVVIVVSSSDDQGDVKRAYQLGADSYLVKHPSPNVLSHIYAVAMEVRSRRRTRCDLRPALARHSISADTSKAISA